MKILLIGEYSNVHNTLAQALRKLGHRVTVASNGDFWKNYPRDIDLARGKGRRATLRFALKLACALPKMRGYDVVQLINPMFVELKAQRLFALYKYLRRNNKNVFLGAFGMDYYWVSECRSARQPLRYSDFNIANRLRDDNVAREYIAEWVGTAKQRLNTYIAADCDGIAAGLYEYWVCYQPNFPQKTAFIPFPIKMPAQQTETESTTETGTESKAETETESTTETGFTTESESTTASGARKIKIFIGINLTRHAYKGTDIMLTAAQRIAEKYPDRVELIKAESVPFCQYRQMMNSSDIILDQLYSYTPAMNALLAMSKGIVCVGGGEPENYEIINEAELRPIINVLPNEEDVYLKIEKLIMQPERIANLKKQSIEYVRRHHDYIKVARQYLDFWQKHARRK